MKYISRILAILLAIGFATSCQDSGWAPKNNEVPEVGVFGDEMRISLDFTAPDPVQVDTRAVDPDGKTLQTINLFCFDANGLFLTTTAAQVNANEPEKEDEEDDEKERMSGTFSATIPKTTRIIHLVANQNMSVFNQEEYVYRTEDDVLSALEGSAGMLIYWARIQAPLNLNELYKDAKYTTEHDNKTSTDERTEAEAFVDWLTIETNPTTETHRGIAGKGHPIIMLRNQAKFTIVSEGTGSYAKDKWKGDYFEVTGFVVCNIPAFGTVAPYNTEYGFPTYACSTFTPEFGVVAADGVANDWLTEKQVTLAARREKMSDIADVTTQREYYVFETNNQGTDPVDLILRGKNIVNGVPEAERYYYRVNIIDNDGEFVKILRNHHYEIHINGNLSNGCLTFGEALVAPPTNNIWISISDEVNSVRNKDFVLTVEKTKETVETDANGMPKQSELELNFNIKALHDAAEVEPGKITVYWTEDEQKISSTHAPSLVLGRNVTYNETTGDGTIRLAMNKLAEGAPYERGSLVVKYGNLQRKIRIVLMRTQKFVPTWVSAEVYGKTDGSRESRSNVTVVFNIPETCPQEMFPFDVLVTTNSLDGRAATGQILPIVRIGEDGYGQEFETTAPDGKTVTDLGYKYKITVNGPGQQRLYFQNIIDMTEEEVEYVTLEAEHFDLVTKMVTYSEHKREIVLPNLNQYIINPDATEQENVKYLLVPQKRFAPVVFDIQLKDTNGNPFGTLTNEEFLLYSTNLDHYPDTDSRIPATDNDIVTFGNYLYTFSKSNFDCYFKPYSQTDWSTGGRIFGFYPREGKLENGTFWDNKNCFQIYLETNKPNSAEIVRIASNQNNSPSVISNRFSYTGNTFRSTTFELANYRPFRFAAQVNGTGNYVGDDATSGTQEPEIVDNIEFTYLPNETVAVSFDVTSFHTKDIDGNNISIDPFGTAFEIFIDAPMLKLEYGMNQIYGDKYEDIKVTMFDKDANGIGYTEEKPKLEDLGNGRFVYRVDAVPGYERGCWNGNPPFIKDVTKGNLTNGDRKTIYFKKNSIVSNGEITVSANPDHVTYHSKTFKVSNTPITGSIKYKTDGVAIHVPHGQFVSFAREYDGSRIGSMTVVGDEYNPEVETHYELRLRAEYDFGWVGDPIKILTQVDGEYYSAVIEDLSTLYNNRNIVLELEVE